ncbi:IS1182 family transposase [Paenibacillus sp. Soil787]|uniref:IS1182 family transposase n=1 Tax=Paenibacillus sp. Soil787 TaxID=1736411 RepID=UPI000702527B|nr:IS1182 family transposase [Paenibacillus sp. Soil787]KRF12002.1 hypothetical protein ASG93_14360 [Paenibacillus sp. Soil787]
MAKFRPYSTEQGELIPTYLSEWVPEEHLARLISDIVDQLDLSVLTEGYSNRGEEAYHPAMLLKLWFYGYTTGVFTSRKIRTALDENIPFRWLCGGDRPDFRTISDFRKNNVDRFAELFKQIVQIAMDLGYISLGHVSIDGSKLKANASKHKAMSRERMKQEIVRLDTEIHEALEKAKQADEQDKGQLSLFPETLHTAVRDRQARLAKIRAALQTLEERKPEAESRTPEKDQINFTDEGSRIMDTRTKGVLQGYNPQIAVDAGHHFIVGCTMSNNTNDHNQFEGVLDSIQENTGRMPKKATADNGYFSAENIRSASKAKVDAYIAPSREGKEPGNAYDKNNFTYVPESDAYICPAGHTLMLKQTGYATNPEKETTWIYSTDACLTCPFQKDCVKSKTGKRTVKRTESDPIREAMRTKVQSDEGKAVYSKRKTIVEPAWGVMKEIQGFRQFHLRGVDKVKGEFILLSLSYNLRKLHSMKYPKEATIYKRQKSAQKRQIAA